MRTKAKRTVLGNRCLLWFPVTSIQRSWGLWPFMEGWEAVRLFSSSSYSFPLFCLFVCLCVCCLLLLLFFSSKLFLSPSLFLPISFFYILAFFSKLLLCKGGKGQDRTGTHTDTEKWKWNGNKQKERVKQKMSETKSNQNYWSYFPIDMQQVVIGTNTNFYRNSFKFQDVLVWNQIPNYIKN